MKKVDLKDNEILVLRTSGANGESYGGFVWPKSGIASAPDWDGKPKCGGGLHGLPRGCGSGSYLSWDDNVTAQIVRVDTSNNYIDLGDKCKFERGEVVYFGNLHDAIEIMVAYYPDLPIIGKTATAGDRGTATAGYRGTATAGDSGTATAGDRGTATAGYSGTATAGDSGTATAGDRGTATAGNYGTATAGNCGTATAGDMGTATAGDMGTATSGNDGVIAIRRWNGKRYKFEIGYIGEDGLLPNVKYRLDDDGKFVTAE